MNNLSASNLTLDIQGENQAYLELTENWPLIYEMQYTSMCHFVPGRYAVAAAYTTLVLVPRWLQGTSSRCLRRVTDLALDDTILYVLMSVPGGTNCRNMRLKVVQHAGSPIICHYAHTCTLDGEAITSPQEGTYKLQAFRCRSLQPLSFTLSYPTSGITAYSISSEYPSLSLLIPSLLSILAGRSGLASCSNPHHTYLHSLNCHQYLLLDTIVKMKAFLSLLALVVPAFAEELVARGEGGGGGGGWGGGDSTTTEVIYTTSK